MLFIDHHQADFCHRLLIVKQGVGSDKHPGLSFLGA